MKKFLIILPLILLAGCEYRYRYECQDPANWGKESCNNDVCKAEGDCASDVLGFTPKVAEQFKSGTSSPAPLDNFVPESTQGISNSATTNCSVADKPRFKPYNATVQQNTFRNNQQQNTFKPIDSIKRPRTEDVVGQIEEAVEAPLTMNTIVDTTGHNNAIKFN